ncbi:hypothetical protein [Croceicoccus sediminis]|uniref:hypothetical protein n=1 Tax=Croceicoccus sediminis TaxID=2571150 RepID=UPI001183292D|nr:hypothetical protein [Croceicoccus sediminis]
MTWLKTTTFCASLSALAFAGPAAAQSKPATPEQVAEAIDVCAAITSSTWIELDDLRGHGWRNVRKSGGNRQMVVRGAYEKSGNEAYIVVTKENLRDKTCMVMTKLDTTADYNPLARDVSAVIGMPVSQDGFIYTWLRSEKTVEMNPSGDRSSPKALFVVSAAQESAE